MEAWEKNLNEDIDLDPFDPEALPLPSEETVALVQPMFAAMLQRDSKGSQYRSKTLPSISRKRVVPVAPKVKIYDPAF